MSWLASTLGYERHSEADFFYHLLLLVLFVYFVLTMMSSFARPDFLNLTILCLCVVQINEPRHFRRSMFRALIVLLIVSILYDTIWTIYLSSEYYKSEQLPEESTIEVYHKQNAVTCTIFNIIWKTTVLLPTVWRVSVDFKAILRDRS